eukprot:3269875-Prymnesium_polylepis.1
MKIDKNGTRVAARHNLLGSQIPLCNALPLYHSAKSKSEEMKWTTGEQLFIDMAQIESVLNVTQVTTKLAQYEQAFTGAYDPLIKGFALRGLEAPTMQVADLNNLAEVAKLNRISLPVANFGELGNAARTRAMIEAQRRFCVGAEKTETVITPTPDIQSSDRSLVATLLDLRTCSGSHLSKEQFSKAKELYYAAYVDFAQKATDFKKAEAAAWEKKAAAQAIAAAAEAASSGAATSAGGEVKFSATTYGAVVHSSSDEEPASSSAPMIGGRGGYCPPLIRHSL